MALLSVQNITLKFGGVIALNDLSFDIEKGQIVSIVGPNGAGKTTAFNSIYSICNAEKGKILLENQTIKEDYYVYRFIIHLIYSLFLGLLFFFIINIQTIWQKYIIDNYIYRQPFAYFKSLNSLNSFWSIDIYESTYTIGFSSCFFYFCIFYTWYKNKKSPLIVAKSGLSRTFQNIRIFPELSVLDNIMIGFEKEYKSSLISEFFNLSDSIKEKNFNKEKALEIATLLEIENFLSRKSKELSYGEQRRLEIARALCTNPKILLLDEPAAGMNTAETHELMEIIKKIRNTGITVLIIEHHMKLVMSISDKIIVLNFGNKIAEGTPHEIQNNPKVIEAYLGSNKEF